MKKRLVVVLAVTLVLSVWIWVKVGREDSATQSAGHLTAAVTASGQAGAIPTQFDTGTESLPASLRGTEVDGKLEVDAAGHLKITREIRNLFDYFLSAIGEETLPTLLARIRAYLHHSLPPVAEAEAQHILQGYIGFRQAVDKLQAPTASTTTDVAALRQRVQMVQQLRHQYLDPPVIQAFFGDEDAYDQYTLDRMAIMQDKSLSASEKAKRVSESENQLPAELKASVDAVNKYQELKTLTEDWQNRGGNAAELRQIRENLVGSEAADRLESLDRDRQAWNDRMQKYLEQRAAILGNNNLSDVDRQQAVAQLRAQSFNTQEVVRVQALEHIHDKQGKS